MQITKEIIECVLYSQWKEQDWDKKSGGECETLYMVSNLFHDAQFAKYAIEKILEAYAEVMQIVVEKD